MSYELLDQLLCKIESDWSPSACQRLIEGVSPHLGRDIIKEHRTKLLNVVAKATAIFRNAEANIGGLHNSLNPINRLPLEILGMIFRLTVEDAYRDAIPISETCSLWRKVALDDGGLWSTLDLTNLSRIRATLFISRSKSHPLTFHSPSSSRFAENGWRESMITRHLARTEVLTLKVQKEHPWLMTESAPGLRRLHVDNTEKSEDIILPYFFNGATPKLRVLTLDRFRMHWKTGYWKYLTELDLTLASFSRITDDEEDVRATFSESPFLEVLRLHQIHNHRDPGQDLLPFVGPRLPLVHLREVWLALPLPYMIHILQAIVLPDNLQNMYLRAKGPLMEHFKLTDLMKSYYIPEALLSRLSHCAAVVAHGRSSYIGSVFGGQMQDYDSQYTITHGLANYERYAAAIENRNVLARIESLHIEVEWSDDEGPMAGTQVASVVSLLRNAPSVTSLSISWSSHSFPGFLSGLTAMADLELCKSLTELKITNSTEPWTLDTLNKLVALCKHLRCGRPLTRLYVDGHADTPVKDLSDSMAILRLLDQMGLRYSTRKNRRGDWYIEIDREPIQIDESWPHEPNDLDEYDGHALLYRRMLIAANSSEVV